MPQARRGARTVGPMFIAARGRWRVLAIGADGRRRSREFSDQATARHYQRALAREIERAAARTVGETVDECELYRRSAGVRLTTIATWRKTVDDVFRACLDRPLAWLTRQRLQEAYDALRARGVSVAYHRQALVNARGWLRWAAERDYLDAPALADLLRVHGVGRAKRGKPQLTADETLAFYETCIRAAEAATERDDLERPVAALLCLAMGLRSGEVRGLVCRCVDRGGTALDLRQIATKTYASATTAPIPADLQPLVARLVDGRTGDATLFVTGHSSEWLRDCVHRMCDLSRVRWVCPHGLRGTSGTRGLEASALWDSVVAHLRHSDRAVSQRHYVAPDAARAAEVEQRTRALKRR